MSAALVSGLLALDMIVNGFLFCGSFRETISACWGKTLAVSTLARIGCAALDIIDAHHCRDAAIGR